MRTSRLTLRWTDSPGGGGRVDRRYLDFVIDELSLGERLAVGPLVSTLGVWPAEVERRFLRQLLARGQADAPSSSSSSGRAPLYVCATCGGSDVECGVLTVRITRTEAGILWSDLGFASGAVGGGLDAQLSHMEPYPEVGPFLFEKGAYWRVLNDRAAAVGAGALRRQHHT